MKYEDSKRETLVDVVPSIWEYDLHPPALRSGLVYRKRLVDQLDEPETDVVTVVAPAGYGKTTALAQWAETASTGSAWLTLSEGDNEVRTLLLRIAASLLRSGVDIPIDTSRLSSSEKADPTSSVLDDLFRAFGQVEQPFALILDNAQLLRHRSSIEIVREMVRQLEGRIRVIISSRSDLELPTADLRAHGRLLELTEADLALTAEEVNQLLEGMGRGKRLVAEELTNATDGWPAALSLIVGANRNGMERSASFRPEGAHRFISEFIHEEILPPLPETLREFLKQMSPLERISGPLSEAVAGTPEAPKLLRNMATDTHLVHPIEGDNGWYEMNRVVRRVLQVELEDNDPETSANIHTRAARWYEANGMPLEAIGHARKAGDSTAFANLVERLIKAHYVAGHAADVLMWMEWLESNVPLIHYPNLAAIGALVHIQEGNTLEATRWLEAADQEPLDPDTGAVFWTVRAAMTSSGVEQMVQDIEMALEVGGRASRWLPAILVTKGLAHLMEGETELAESCFVEAAKIGLENQSLSSVVLALGQRALLAIGRKEWDLASELARQALEIIDEHGYDGYHTSSLALIAAARCARRDNDIRKAQAHLARASLARTRLSAAMPGESVQILTEMARAYVELSDVPGARTLIREAEDIVIQRPHLGVLPPQVKSVKDSLDALGPGTVGLSALTKAELRLLPFLATNLSFPEIGDELYISRHTVKTQAMSIYRKLGTSSRSDAVAKAYETGLLRR